MCRLFGMSGGHERVRATFWLLEAPDSLALQSRREPDGTGLGFFGEDGLPVVEKQPLAAYEDRDFAREAREVCSRTFIAHVRYASGSAVAPQNTHPFEQAGRLFAHNGVIEGIDRLDAELGEDRALVRGETDSEHFFALITREIERARRRRAGNRDRRPLGGRAACPCSRSTSCSSMPTSCGRCATPIPTSCSCSSAHPAARRRAPPRPRQRARVGAGALGRSGRRAAVVVASEKMDEDPGWRALRSGELCTSPPT